MALSTLVRPGAEQYPWSVETGSPLRRNLLEQDFFEPEPYGPPGFGRYASSKEGSRLSMALLAVKISASSVNRIAQSRTNSSGQTGTAQSKGLTSVAADALGQIIGRAVKETGQRACLEPASVQA